MDLDFKNKSYKRNKENREGKEKEDRTKKKCKWAEPSKPPSYLPHPRVTSPTVRAPPLTDRWGPPVGSISFPNRRPHAPSPTIRPTFPTRLARPQQRPSLR